MRRDYPQISKKDRHPIMDWRLSLQHETRLCDLWLSRHFPQLAHSLDDAASPNELHTLLSGIVRAASAERNRI